MRILLGLRFLALTVLYYVAGAEELALTPGQVAAARKLYVAKCAKCHRFYEPTNYAEPNWRTWMEKMNQKSKLKGEPASLLARYLDAYRAGRLTGKPEDKPTMMKSMGPRPSSPQIPQPNAQAPR